MWGETLTNKNIKPKPFKPTPGELSLELTGGKHCQRLSSDIHKKFSSSLVGSVIEKL